MKPQRSSTSSSLKLSVAVATPILVLLALAVVSLYDFSFAADSYQDIRRASSASSTSSANTSSPSTAPATSSPSPAPPTTNSSSSAATATEAACALTRGQWVPDDAPPYYTNLTCPFIDDLQNCMKFGKPSLEFMRWRWQPDGCDLPRFDAARFLEAMRGRSMAFVGDSLARNHVKSLLCILSQVRTCWITPLHMAGLSSQHVRVSWHTGTCATDTACIVPLLLMQRAFVWCRWRSRWRS